LVRDPVLWFSDGMIDYGLACEGRTHMRRRFVVVLCISLTLCTIATFSFAQGASQVATDSLRVWQGFSGYKYEHGSEKGNVGWVGTPVKNIVQDNLVALHSVGTFGKLHVPAMVGTLISGGMIGFGFAADENEVAYIGLGTLAISFVVDQFAYSHLKKAARLFNRDR
jgi:hypothetical protein